MVFSNVIVDVTISCRSFVFSQSRAKASAGFRQIGSSIQEQMLRLPCDLHWWNQYHRKFTANLNKGAQYNLPSYSTEDPEYWPWKWTPRLSVLQASDLSIKPFLPQWIMKYWMFVCLRVHALTYRAPRQRTLQQLSIQKSTKSSPWLLAIIFLKEGRAALLRLYLVLWVGGIWVRYYSA